MVNINTLTGDGELVLAILFFFAQEDSGSISENMKWTVKKSGGRLLSLKRTIYLCCL